MKENQDDSDEMTIIKTTKMLQLKKTLWIWEEV